MANEEEVSICEETALVMAETLRAAAAAAEAEEEEEGSPREEEEERPT